MLFHQLVGHHRSLHIHLLRVSPSLSSESQSLVAIHPFLCHRLQKRFSLWAIILWRSTSSGVICTDVSFWTFRDIFNSGSTAFFIASLGWMVTSSNIFMKSLLESKRVFFVAHLTFRLRLHIQEELRQKHGDHSRPFFEPFKKTHISHSCITYINILLYMLHPPGN